MMAKKKKTSGKKITKTPRFIFSKYFYSPYYDFRKNLFLHLFSHAVVPDVTIDPIYYHGSPMHSIN